jgi:hypothetical protein
MRCEFREQRVIVDEHHSRRIKPQALSRSGVVEANELEVSLTMGPFSAHSLPGTTFEGAKKSSKSDAFRQQLNAPK